VSGGCLERDVIRRARNLIDGGPPAVVRYDTTDEQDDFGGPAPTLGCQGIIDLFLEPVSTEHRGPMPALRRAIEGRRPVALATLVRSRSPTAPPPASRIMFDGSGGAELVGEDLRALLHSGEGGLRPCALPDGSTADFFFELLRPPQALVLFGGGPDVVPLVAIAKTLGWHVTVIASHGSPGYRERFAAADVVAAGTEDEPLAGVEIGADAAVVLMTHNYFRDLQVLPALLRRAPRYLGILGPRRRTERLVIDAGAAEMLPSIFGPVGLDLGADTPQTIALAIAAEIQAVLAGRPTRSLRDRPGPIYEHPEAPAAAASDLPYNPPSCPLSA
jgi:xanthine/CO dehydrogenase XdhC/CoxF family maturation factor